MRSDSTETGYDGQGLKGPGYWIAGVLTAIAAKAVSGPGGLLGGILGGGLPPPGAEPVTQKVLDLTAENQQLKAERYADRLNTAQVAWNATQEGKIACIEKQVERLFDMTRLTIPNENLTPGVGPVQVLPVPPPAVPAPPDVATIVAAVLAAQKSSATQQGQ